MVASLIFIFNKYGDGQKLYSSQPILKHNSGTGSYFMMNILENLRTFLIKFPLKIKAIGDTYDSDYKPGIERAAALSATKTHGVYQAPNVEESPFKTWDQLKKSN